jgi:hypothetical protein
MQAAPGFRAAPPGGNFAIVAHPMLEEDGWPLAVTTWPARVTEDELRGYFERLKRLFEKRTPFVHILDGRSATPESTSARLRGLATDFQRGLDPRQRALVLGEAYIVDSAFLRGVLTALGWVFPPPWPRESFRDRASAEAWARGRLGRSGGERAAC